MKRIIFSIVLLIALSANGVSAQKKNLDKLLENKRNEYLLKKAKEAIMTHGPDWYRDYKEPEIKSFVVSVGPDKGRLVYSIRYYYDPKKEKMEYDYAVVVGIYADSGEVRGLSFGDGIGYKIPPKTRNKEKPYVRPCPYPRPK